jgi:hypothetical protein
MKTQIFALVIFALLSSVTYAKGGLGELFGALIGKSVGNAVGKSFLDTPSIESALTKMADQLNKRLPMAVDKETRWDNILPGPGRRFTYNYTIVAAKMSDIDKAYFRQTMQAHLKNHVCASPDMKIFFINGITVGYSYRAADGIFLEKIDLTPKDCGIS